MSGSQAPVRPRLKPQALPDPSLPRLDWPHSCLPTTLRGPPCPTLPHPEWQGQLPPVTNVLSLKATLPLSPRAPHDTIARSASHMLLLGSDQDPPYNHHFCARYLAMCSVTWNPLVHPMERVFLSPFDRRGPELSAPCLSSQGRDLLGQPPKAVLSPSRPLAAPQPCQ